MWELFRDRINHLSKKDKYELIQEYYQGELSNTKLIKKYKIKKVAAGDLHKCFPVQSSDRICRHCKLEMKLLPKFGKIDQENIFWCESCGHIDFINRDEKCVCESCISEHMRIIFEDRRKIAERKLGKDELIYEVHSNHQINSNNTKSYSIGDIIKLGSFLDLYLNESSEYTDAIYRHCGKLTPSSAWSNEIIIYLYEKQLIDISEKSPVKAFYENTQTGLPTDFQIDKVFFYPILDDENGELKKILSGDVNCFFNTRTDDEQNKMIQESYEFWKLIGVSECIEFLLYQMSKVGLWFSPGRKTKEMFEYLLNHLSISEIFALINSGVTYTCRIQKEKNMDKKHLSNTAVSIIRTNGDKMVSGDWEKRKFNRPYDLEQSNISKYFFYRLLKIGVKGYEVRPNKELLRNQILKDEKY